MSTRKIVDKAEVPENKISRQTWIMIVDLLRWCYLPGDEGEREWRKAIMQTHRREMSTVLNDHPHLYKFYVKTFMYYYPIIRNVMADEENRLLSLSPEICPWTADEMIDPEFFPNAQPPQA